MRLQRSFLCCAFLLLLDSSFAQQPAMHSGDQPLATTARGTAPNSNATYQQLRNVGLSGETSQVNNLVLKRDAGVFTFKSGVLQFLAPVNGKVTGAIFIGAGTFSMVPPLAAEKRSLSLLTKEPAVNEDFNSVVLRFTDGTYEELKKSAGSSSGAPADSSELNNIRHALQKKLHYNLDGRILQDVLSSEPGGLFYAFIRGQKYNGKEIFAIDPHGVGAWAPEEVVFQTWDEAKYGVWATFHYSDEYKTGKASGTQQNGLIAIEKQKLDTQIEKSGKLNGDATTTIVARRDGVSVVPFELFPTLRVSSVVDAAGQPLDFVQEGKDDDADFSVILPRALKAGEKYVLRTIYSGKEAVTNEGNGNYFPVARSDWFPSMDRGNYAEYEMSFRIPKGMTMVATGTQVRAANEGDQNISEWKTEVPQRVAGFNFGKFKRIETKEKNFTVESYANENPPNWVRSVQNTAEDAIPVMDSIHTSNSTLGSMDTTSLIKKPLAEAQLAMGLYTSYFGPSSYKRVAMTQQMACDFGQSWPTLVYMPICVYFDSTVQHQLGLDDARGYWNSVAPHEVAHQWWGHTVGWSSYRDQWMSEGFAEMSASLYLQMIQSPQRFIKFWNDERELLTERNTQGYRAIDVGPVTMGYRLNNTKSGFDITRRLIYPKGGYILHMIRMMMWSNSKGDEAFKAMMKDFVTTYANKPASTEDFKAMVEKHMTAEMDMDHNRKMDWFFDSYVYGTTMPNYKFEHSIDNGPNGLTLNVKITQSNVDDRFIMLVPLYMELANGKVVRLGSASIEGNKTIQQSIPLGNVKDRPKRAILNYYDDVLATMDK